MSVYCPHCGGDKDKDVAACSDCVTLFAGDSEGTEPAKKSRPRYDDVPELLKRQKPLLPPLPPETEQERRMARRSCVSVITICFVISLGVFCLCRVIAG